MSRPAEAADANRRDHSFWPAEEEYADPDAHAGSNPDAEPDTHTGSDAEPNADTHTSHDAPDLSDSYAVGSARSSGSIEWRGDKTCDSRPHHEHE